MPAELSLPVTTLVAFLLVATRVGAALVFVPIPGIRKGAAPARIVLVLALTMLLYPQWPVLAAPPPMGLMAAWLVADAAIGILAGVLVGFIAESFQVAAQAVGLEAGFAYASMVDPQTKADSGILLVFAQLGSGLIFFALGLDREVIRIFARSLETLPPGAI
ncbi:MAG TPA: flagellar biosynthetic protein FliR, partial [Candidatus Omnitrophota bacterium]|nr:flagellar biosynthetic protein FliR [Candidatus Omnitrophota bacterium]